MADDTSPDPGDGDETRENGPPENDSETTSGSASPFLFLLGLLAFLGSVVTFLADLVTGYDVLRSLLINAGSAVVLVWWAAADTLSDPESSVTSRSGAAGTALLLLGLYLLAGAVVVGVTSLVHDRFDLVPWAAGLGVGTVVVGFLVFPRGSVLDRAEDGEEATAGSAETGVTDETGDADPKTGG